MKRPSFQFYPGDWQGSSNLRRCSHAEKGAWLDVMCILHDQEEYGVLRWSLKEIAQAVGCPVALLNGLVTKGVLKGDDKHLREEHVYTPHSGRKDGEPVTLISTQAGPIWYSSRMVKDEYVRTIRGESTRFGDGRRGAKQPPKYAPKHSPKPPLGDGASSSSSSSSIQSSPSITEPPGPGSVGDDGRFSEFQSQGTWSDGDAPHWPDTLTPATPVDWASVYGDAFGVAISTARPHEWAKFTPLATAWCAAGVTVGQMRAAVTRAHAEAGEPIAYLPGYADRVLASMVPKQARTPALAVVPADPDSRSAIEAEGVAKGIGPWNELLEQWPQYRRRVRGPAQTQGFASLAAIVAKGLTA